MQFSTGAALFHYGMHGKIVHLLGGDKRVRWYWLSMSEVQVLLYYGLEGFPSVLPQNGSFVRAVPLEHLRSAVSQRWHACLHGQCDPLSTYRRKIVISVSEVMLNLLLFRSEGFSW